MVALLAFGLAMAHALTPDQGFAWVILAANFFAHMLSYGMSWTAGVFYVLFLDHLQYDNPYQVTLAPALNAGMFSFIGKG